MGNDLLDAPNLKELEMSVDPKKLKDIFCGLSDNSPVDLILQDANGGGLAVGGIDRQQAMDVSPVIAITLPDGYFLTTKNPIVLAPGSASLQKAVGDLNSLLEKLQGYRLTGSEISDLKATIALIAKTKDQIDPEVFS
jgi:hypothetical protein